MAGRIHPAPLPIEDDEGLTRMLQLASRRAGFDATHVTTHGNAPHTLEEVARHATALGFRPASRIALEGREGRVDVIDPTDRTPADSSRPIPHR
jgi:hypothetical protein